MFYEVQKYDKKTINPDYYQEKRPSLFTMK